MHVNNLSVDFNIIDSYLYDIDNLDEEVEQLFIMTISELRAITANFPEVKLDKLVSCIVDLIKLFHSSVKENTLMGN